MMPVNVMDFLHGGTMVALLGIALYFLRFWKESGDRLFVFFCAAFFVMSVSQALSLFFVTATADSTPYVYWLRLVSFLLIIVGIVEKNLPPRASAKKKGDESGS
jgi:hypothetical protein